VSEARIWPLFARLAIGAAVLAAIGGALVACFRWQRDRQLVADVEAAERELDESDPGWRLEELHAARPHVPEAENSAVIIRRVAEAIPSDWPDQEANKLFERYGVESNTLLDAEQVKALEGQLALVARQRRDARGLSKYPRGKFEYALGRNPRTEPFAHRDWVRRVETLLRLDALALAQRGDIGEALVSVRAAAHLTRSLEEEPWLITHVTRCEVFEGAASHAELVLALGEASDDQLAALQETLSPLTNSTSHLLAVRGERAALHRIYEGLVRREFTPGEVGIMFDPGSPDAKFFRDSEVLDRAHEFHPTHLRYMTRLVEAARLPAHQQAAAEDVLEQEDRSKQGEEPLRFFLTPSFRQMGEPSRAALTAARALHALVGSERYRLKHGGWPKRLDDLVPAFLPKVPLDPQDGKPMRYRKWADGVVVYSVGEDRADDGGDVAGPAPKDHGFRLWDAGKRRQTAPPAKDKP
jgi:hypothetical protein